MARLLPPQTGKRTRSNAERKLAERFKNELPLPAVLMHSVGLVRHQTKRWAEADFVLVSSAGIFCLEVKGGRVSRRDGVWEFKSADGTTGQKFESPFDQAGGAAGALQSWLKGANVLRDSGKVFQVGWGVMIPDDYLNAKGPDIEPGVLLDLSWKGRSLHEYVDSLGAYWQERLRSEPLNDVEIARLVEAIRPDFDGLMHRRLIGDRIEEQLVRLTDDQERVIRSATLNDRVWVQGGAGTGKTILATLEAERFAAEGKRTLLLTSTRALAIELGETLPNEIRVETKRSALTHLVQTAGLSSELGEPVEDQGSHSLRLRELAERAAAIVGPEFDALVVDEGQDVLATSALTSLAALLDGGLANGTWRIFGDPNQSIFGQPNPQALDAVASGSPVRIQLLENCRNTQEVAHYVSLLAGSELTFTPVKGPSANVCHEWDRPEIERVREIVTSYIDTTDNPDDITILTHSGRLRDEIASALEHASTRRGDPRSAFVSTIAAFKGQEARVIILAGLPTLAGGDWPQTAYVGASRATTELHIVLPDSARASFDQRNIEFGLRMADYLRSGSR